MIDANDIIQNNNVDVAATAVYIADLLAKGIFAGIGKDIWEKIKIKASTVQGKKVVKSFEENPNDKGNMGKLELLIETWMEQDELFKSNVVNLLKANNLEAKIILHDSKNFVVSSSVNVNNGNIRFGDNIS